MREAIDGLSSSHPPQDQRSDSEPNILEQFDAYVEEDVDVLEEVNRYQSDEGEQKETPCPH